MTTYMHYATLLEAASALKSRKVSAVELTRALLDRIEKIDPSLHSYATVTPELALKQSKAYDAEIAAGDYRGPLHGVPIAVKDICNAAGVVTAAGMTIHADNVPDHDSTVVRRLRDAGAVLLGKLQNTEGAFVSHHPKITPPRNPWNADYYAGASSSGSGVATAAGLCFGSLGSDTGGSIRFPSAANGITGLKPTWGRVSRHGVFALAESLDHIGPMARSAADAGAILGVIAGRDSEDPTTLVAPVPDYLAGLDTGIREVRIGIDAAYSETGCDSQTVTAVREARKVFETLGATIKEVTLPDPSGVMVTTAWGTICAPETALAHKARPRVQRAPGLPCALRLSRG
jgi:amidase